MSTRKPLPKSLRFEVFKRDSFKCQYCGRSAPDVILEVDHIVPVAGGGKDDPINLITSCRDCNRGKGSKQLSDKTTIDKQKKQLDELNEIREQTEMLIQWKTELLTIGDSQIDAIDNLITSLTNGWGLSDSGRRTIRGYIKRFGFPSVYEAIEISFCRYYDDEDCFDLALYKVGGICYNKAKQKESGDYAE